MKWLFTYPRQYPLEGLETRIVTSKQGFDWYVGWCGMMWGKRGNRWNYKELGE